MEKKLNILLVDDSNVIISAIQELLSGVQNIQKIEVATTLAIGQHIVRTTKVDVVILDLQLPDGNGMDLLRFIKKQYPEITVIMFTSFSEPFFRGIMKKMGSDYFFDKSSEFEKMQDVLSKM